MEIVKKTMPIDNSKYDGFGPSTETRYVIVDGNGKTVDDAQGYGYKTRQKAAKAMWWKFKGGKEQSNEKAKWWKKHRDLYDAVQDFLLVNFKEIARGELTNDDVDGYIKKIAKDDFGIDLPEDMLKFLNMKGSSKMIER